MPFTPVATGQSHAASWSSAVDHHRLWTDNCEDRLDEHIAASLARPSGWLIYNLHGMDEEGWGPIRAEHQNELLERINRIESIAILPVGKALSIKE